MPDPQPSTASLGLTGITSNARTLIAPAAFVWILFSIQCLYGAPDAGSDIFCGLLLALLVSLSTAVSYAELSAFHPATGNAYFYVLQNFLAQTKSPRIARIARFLLSLSSHLSYCLFPALIISAATLLAGYLAHQLFPAPFPSAMPIHFMLLFALLFSFLIAYTASRGIGGTTRINAVLNILQISALVIFSFLAIYYRLHNTLDPTPILSTGNANFFQNAIDILKPHAAGYILLQASLAILVFTAFESVIAMGGGKSARRTIPRAVLITLFVQGCFCYCLEYFASEYALTWKFGMEDAAKSPAPLADLMQIVGTHFFGSINAGWWFMFIEAAIVLLALLSTALASLTSAAQISYAINRSRTSSLSLGLLQTNSPIRATWLLASLSALITGAILLAQQPLYAFLSLALLTALGTLLLYFLINLAALTTFKEQKILTGPKRTLLPLFTLLAIAAIILFYLLGPLLIPSVEKSEPYTAFLTAAALALYAFFYFTLKGPSSTLKK